MIESISLLKVASYGSDPAQMDGLSNFNFVYGSNGCGKTTISRVIADEAQFESCRVNWKGGTPLEALVYNRDFVDKNFSESTALKGVFTLGEQNVETLAKIASLKSDVDGLTTKLEKLTLNLEGTDGKGGKLGELDVHESTIKDQCWGQKQKHDKKFQASFEGFRNSAEKFKTKVFQERTSNKGKVCTLQNLESRAETIFGTTPTPEAFVATIGETALVVYEKDSILKKRVIGKDDVDVAAMIKALGNSDWVREGRGYFEQNDGRCPFCQQDTETKFEVSLRAYFDETFENDSRAIEKLHDDYRVAAARLQLQLETISTNPSRFIEAEKLKLEKQVFDTIVTVNLQRLETKRKEPSTEVSLESLESIVASVSKLIDEANVKISSHNKTVQNLSQERKQLTADVWKFVLSELHGELTTYDSSREAVQKAIDGMKLQKSAASKEKTEKESDIRDLEKQTTSIQPTVDGINSLLKSFGFQGFTLANAPDGASYRLLRSDGSDAKMTLSEGEKTFVTFLYFYHLLKGSDSQSGMTRDRVVVFDDPVSSLDSDILFIVGSLIKGVLDEVRSGASYIKQVFILTHNVYFHKEVTFNPRRVNDAMNEETFWVVRKTDAVSTIEKHTTNPIKTSYELLWNEVRSPIPSRHTIQNTLRRILENYFRILGGIDPDNICAMFEGKEKLLCKSLFSWVNDGSHYAHDDLYVSIDDEMVQSYLSVFKNVFEKSKHIAHYEMMMGINS